MTLLKYKVIKNRAQYNTYCTKLEELVDSGLKNQEIKDEIDLLTVLIEKWDTSHHSFTKVDPIRLLRSLMDDHHMKAKDLVELLTVSKGYVSDILNYKKGLSKEVIRQLAAHFKLSHEAFNRHYDLVMTQKSRNGKAKPQIEK